MWYYLSWTALLLEEAAKWLLVHALYITIFIQLLIALAGLFLLPPRNR